MTHFIKPERTPKYNGMYIFSKNVDISEESEYTVKLFASTRYIMYVNGEYICEGPCRGPQKVRYFDEVKVRFKKGNNEISIKVMHLCEHFVTVFKENAPAVVFEATDGKNAFISDESWTCKFLTDHKLLKEGMYSLPPYESVKADGNEEELRVVCDWNCELNDDGYYDIVGCSAPYVLNKRPIPMIYPTEEVTLRPVRIGDGFAEYDAGCYVTAKMKFDFVGKGSVKIIYSECYEFKDGKKQRDDTSGYLNGYYDLVETDEGDFTYETFWFRAFRFIRIEGDCDIVKGIKGYRCNYPYDIQGEFECSDEVYNKIREVSVNTLKCCSHEMVVDCPYYEQQQYEMDFAVEMAMITRITDDTRLIKKAIFEFAESQQPSGLLCSIAPASYTQIIPGYSCFWIMILKDYLEQSTDIEFVSGFVGYMDRIIQYFEDVVRKNGYVVPSKYWDFSDWVPEWENGNVPVKDGEAHTLYNLYYLKALKDASFICEKLGRYGLAEEYMGYYESLKNTINSICYDEKKEMYKDGSVTRTFSMHTIIWAILSDAVSPERRDKLISHIYDKDISKSSFSMNFYLFRAFEKCGKYDMAFELFEQWKKMLDLHCTTWCENPDSPRSECHAWSCAPYYEFSANILGVKIGYENEIVTAPQIGKLTYAKGKVPTRFGLLSVDWKIENGKFKISVSGADKIKKIIVMPSGERKEFIDDITLEEEYV